MRVTKEMWYRFVLKGETQDEIEPIIKESWHRSMKYGINPREIKNKVVYSDIELKKALKEYHRLLEITESYTKNIFALGNGYGGLAVLILDRNGHILKILAESPLKPSYEDMGICPGVSWKEEYMGTNGAGTALCLDKPILIEGHEHFVEKFHGTACFAVPIHDSDGEILAILEMIIPTSRYNKNLWGILITEARGIERELHHMEYTSKIEELNKTLAQKLKDERSLKKDIKEKASLLEAVMNNMSDGLMIYDEKGQLVIANEVIHRINRMDNICPNNMPRDGIPRFLTYKYENGQVIPEEEYKINKMLRGEKVDNEIFIAEHDTFKKYIMANGSTILEDEKTKYIIISFTDITEIHKREIEIKKNREFISNILDRLGTPMVVISYPQLIYEISNHKNNELVHKLIKEKNHNVNLIGKGMEEVGDLFGNHYFMEKVIQVGQGGEEVFLEAVPYHRIGAYYHCIYSPLMDEYGKVTHVAVVALDVTNQVTYRKKMEEITKQKDEFFSIVSHELRSPAAIINLATQMLLSDYYREGLTPPSTKLVHKIKQNSYRLLRLINNFLDMTKIEEGFISMNDTHVDIVNFSKLIMDSLQLFAVDKKIHLKFSSQMKEKVIAIDRDKYERILLNLLSNAFKFTPSNKEILVHIDQVEGYITVLIKDQGIGIPKDELDKIFNRFVQVDSSLSRKSEGTGIGLSLVKALIQRMGGKVEVESLLGEGSSFKIYIPDKINLEGEMLETVIKSHGEMAEVINIEFSDIYW